MKVGLILFHSRAVERYPLEWIERCIASIVVQTVQPDAIYEMDYGGNGFHFLHRVPDYEYHSRRLANYAEAMNFLLDRAFADGCDVVFNTNIDDEYAHTRIETQLAAVLSYQKPDLVSCNFNVIDDDGAVIRTNHFDHLDIAYEFAHDHNVICHPGVAWTRNFWLTCSRYDPAEVPEEDFGLWRRELSRQRFLIVPEVLVNVRSHDHNVGKDPNYR